MRPAFALLAAMLTTCMIIASDADAVLSYLEVRPTCAAGNSVSIRVSFGDQFPHTPLPPAWVGYDLFRRTSPDCPWLSGERVNAEIITRPPGDGSHEVLYVDTPSAAGTYDYFAVFVDADRNPVEVPSCGDCHLDDSGRYGAIGMVSCPANQAPITVGRVVDLGWTLSIEPCAGTCWNGGTLADSRQIEELRPLAGTQAVYRFYGAIGCCSVEGPGFWIDHYDLGTCGPTPTGRASWGRVKAIYR